MNRQLPKYEKKEYFERRNKYALLIPTLNEGERIQNQLRKLKEINAVNAVDIFILDSNSTDNSLNDDFICEIGVREKLIVLEGKQGSAFRAGLNEVLNDGYEGVITVDGNNKDSMESVFDFIKELDNGYDFIQGSRFMKGGKHENTPFIRFAAMKLILIPWVSILSGHIYSEVASAFRAYSAKLISDEKINIFRDCFVSYEFLWHMSVEAPRNGFKVKEIPATRCYPATGKIPTKIKASGCADIILQLIKLTLGQYK